MAPGFTGWTEDFQRFFIGLELDNSKAYFEANKKTYLERVKGPMVGLLAALEPEFGPGKIFRANRDIRFSADKSPYKTNIAATTERGGYVSLDARGLYAGGGHYHLERPQIEAYRGAVADGRSGAELARIVEKLEAEGYTVGGEELKKNPPGYPADHPRGRLLRHKRMYYMKDFGLQPWLGTGRAADRIAKVWRDGTPLTDWLGRVVG